MSRWFIDASVLLAREDEDPDQHLASRELLAGDATLSTLDLALYDVTNIAIRAWRDQQAAMRLHAVVAAVAADGGLVRADEPLVADALRIAQAHGVTVYDAGYVAGAASIGAQLVSCNLRDLVNEGLAITPRQACRPA